MKLFGWTAVVIMLMASSCSDEQIIDVYAADGKIIPTNDMSNNEYKGISNYLERLGSTTFQRNYNFNLN